MLNKHRFFVVSLAVLFAYNAYAEDLYVCERQYNSCEPNYYMTLGGEYSLVPAAGNECTVCPADAYCEGGTYAPLYTVTLNPNGGRNLAVNEFYVAADAEGPFYCNSTWVAAVEECWSEYDEAKMVNLPSNAVSVRENYAFEGYALTSDAKADDVVISSNGAFVGDIPVDSASTLYAVWRVTACEEGKYISGDACMACPADAYCDGGTHAPLYTVTLNPNGGKSGVQDRFYIAKEENGGSFMCDPTWVAAVEECWGEYADANMTKLPTTLNPTRENYVFRGWSLTKQLADETRVDDMVINANGEVITYDDPLIVSYTIPTDKNTTLYAVWERTTCEENQYLTEYKTCEPCPVAYPNSTGSGKGGINECYAVTEPGKYITDEGTVQACTEGKWCRGGYNIPYGQSGGATSCPGNYVNGGTGLSLESQCAWNVPGGSYVKTANDLVATACESGEWKPQHTVTYGATSKPNVCVGQGSLLNGASAEPRDKVESCYIPADTTINDGTGDYVFTTDCGYGATE